MIEKNALLALTALALVPTLRAATPTPIVSLSMDEATDGKITDDIGGKTLTLGAGAIVSNFAAKGCALWFDGTANAYATMPEMPALKSRTVSFWIYRNDTPGPLYDPDKKVNTMPTAFAGLSTQTLRFNNSWISTDDHRLANQQFVCYIGAGGKNNGFYYSMSGYQLMPLGAWTHVAITADVKSETTDGTYTVSTFDARIYFNGRPYSVETDCVISNLSASGTLMLGNVGAKNRPFYGALDEFRVFDTVLTPDQVREEFARASGVCTSRLLAHYPLATSAALAGGGATTPDAAGAVGDLTLSDHATIVDTDVGKAIHFDGTATTRATATVPFATPELTVSMWLRVSTNATIVRVSGQSNNFPWIFYYGGHNYRFFKDLSSTQFQYVVPGDTSVINLTPGYVGKGGWQYWTFVYRYDIDDATAVRQAHGEVWVNGVKLNAGVSKASGTVPQNTTFAIGNATTSGNGTRVFEGDVADFRMYAGALTADEIQRLYRGAAAVSAGTNQVVAADRTVLCGTVADRSGKVFAQGYAGEIQWSLVSSPAGGEGAAFLRPQNPVTEVTLPVEGTYVFRLTASTGFETRTNDVTVVRDDATGALPPTVPDVTNGLATATTDAAAAATLETGLIRHWTMTNPAALFKDEVLGQKTLAAYVYFNNLAGATFGNALDPFDFTHGVSLGETTETFDTYTIPEDEWRTFSLWMYQDGTKTYPHYGPCLISSRTTIYVMLNKYDNPKTDGLQQTPGITIYQAGVKGRAGSLFYAAPFSFTNRWTHVVAQINRHDSSQIELWLDGVKQTATTSYFNKYQSGDAVPSEAIGTCAGGRSGASWHFGGIDYDAKDYSTQSNSVFSVAYDKATGTFYSRTFPGRLADIRLYNRQLTANEIGCLCRHPGALANRAPVVAKAAAPGLTVRKASAISAAAADDGKPASSLTYEWTVVKGDATKVAFGDKTARETTVTVSRSGTYAFVLKVTDGERTTYGEPLEANLASGVVIVIR